MNYPKNIDWRAGASPEFALADKSDAQQTYDD
jgi:hypothetical protein